MLNEGITIVQDDGVGHFERYESGMYYTFRKRRGIHDDRYLIRSGTTHRILHLTRSIWSEVADIARRELWDDMVLIGDDPIGLREFLNGCGDHR